MNETVKGEVKILVAYDENYWLQQRESCVEAAFTRFPHMDGGTFLAFRPVGVLCLRFYKTPGQRYLLTCRSQKAPYSSAQDSMLAVEFSTLKHE